MTTKRPASPAAEPTPPTRVEIAAGGHSVVIESADPLNTVARKALELWKATDSPDVVKGMSSGVGFAADLGPDTYLPPELALPDRLTPGGDDDRRRIR